jgi:uncharacterized protein
MNLTGKLFTCQRCGSCCQGQTTISLSVEDCLRMAAALSLSTEELFVHYLRRTGNCVQMRTVDNHCIFFDQGCRIHAARPKLCGQWPLHPAILKDQRNYQAITTSCPGLNTQLSYEQFCRLLEQILNNGDSIC